MARYCTNEVTMRAVQHHRFGGPDVLTVDDVPEATPRANEVRIRVAAAALNPKDVLIRKGRYALLSGRRFPMGTGFDVAGIVDAVGPSVSSLQVGDRVLGLLDGMSGRTCAESVVLAAGGCALAPTSLSWAQSASLPLAGTTALQALRDEGRVVRGTRVLLHGAAGGVGTLAIQIAKALGAHVTTTSSEGSRARCQELGADETMTYDDPTAPFRDRTSYDAILDVYGNRGFGWASRGLTSTGTFVSTVPSRRLAFDILRTLMARRRARLVVVRPRRRDLETLIAMVQAGTVRPVVDRVLPLDRTAEGHTYLETRRARGKVVIEVNGRYTGSS